MKRILGKITMILVTSLLTLGLAQETAPQGSGGMTMGQSGMSGGTGQGMMGEQQGMMSMMQMMNTCADMMRNMTQMMGGEQMGGMGMMGGQTDMNQMDMSAGTARFNQAAAEALAQAFLSGAAPDAEVTLQKVTLTNGSYTVQYRQGDASGTLAVDAATGEVQPQTPER